MKVHFGEKATIYIYKTSLLQGCNRIYGENQIESAYIGHIKMYSTEVQELLEIVI